MPRTEIDIEAFRSFVAKNEQRLRQALSATLGTQVGVEATAEALGYTWENWDRIEAMNNAGGISAALGAIVVASH